MPRLTREQRDQWAADLESGEFKQCRGNLLGLADKETGEVSYCCLGVLVIRTADLHRADGGLHYSIDRGGLLTYEEEGAFIDMNDIKKLSFPEIAVKVRELPVDP